MTIHAQEGDFIQATVANLQNQNPSQNILMYHDTRSNYDCQGASHHHAELSLEDGAGTTKGYEVFTLDSGTFNRAGDGGYINWCISGSFTMNDDKTQITFHTRQRELEPRNQGMMTGHSHLIKHFSPSISSAHSTASPADPTTGRTACEPRQHRRQPLRQLPEQSRWHHLVRPGILRQSQSGPERGPAA
jgi:hypothetical protein